VPWTFVRPADPSVLAGRPLLDIGTGDGQTVLAVADPTGLVVGLERSLEALRVARRTGVERAVCADAERLPVGSQRVAAVLAADLFHHLDRERLGRVLAEVHRVLVSGGRLVAWWYELPARPAPDAPRFPRPYEEIAGAVSRAGFGSVERLALSGGEEGPPTVGVDARR
jgi:ubiquinone/menaquinone biosynthesis C-methylase UbiE